MACAINHRRKHTNRATFFSFYIRLKNLNALKLVTNSICDPRLSVVMINRNPTLMSGSQGVEGESIFKVGYPNLNLKVIARVKVNSCHPYPQTVQKCQVGDLPGAQNSTSRVTYHSLGSILPGSRARYP